MTTKLTFDLLPALAVLISVLSWYIPGFKDWYQSLKSEKKQLFMVGILAVITLVVVILSYFDFLKIYSGTTWQEWVWYPVVDFGIAVITNAGVYKATNYMLGGGKAKG